MTGCKSTCEPRLNWRFAALTPFAAVIGDVTTVALAFKGVIVIEEWLRCSLFHPGLTTISQSFVVFFHRAHVTIGSLQWFTNFYCFQSQPPSRLMLSSPNYRSSILKSSKLIWNWIVFSRPAVSFEEKEAKLQPGVSCGVCKKVSV